MCALLALALLFGQAPPHPDFSGRWALVTPTSTDTPRVLVVEQPITTRNMRGVPMAPAYLTISIRREAPSGTTTATRWIGITGGVVGGSVGRADNEPRHDERIDTRWAGNSLVFFDETYTGESPRDGQWTERSETWSLDADGRLRVEIVTESWNVARRTDVNLYRREH